MQQQPFQRPPAGHAGERSIITIIGEAPARLQVFSKEATRTAAARRIPFLDFERPIRRSHAPAAGQKQSQRGIEACDERTLQRWRNDDRRYAPIHYRDENGVWEQGTWRSLCAEEREIRLGFEGGHTEPVWGKQSRKANPAGYEDARSGLIGHGLSTPVVAILTGSLLFKLGLLPRLPSVEESWGAAATEAEDSLLLRLRLEGASVDKEVIAHLHRNASYKGADLRLRSGRSSHPNRWPRESVPVERWKWQIGGSFPLSGQHINALEMQAILATFRWRTAKSGSVRARILHIADSQVCLSVLVKGRSSSYVLNRIVSKVNALILAANLLPVYAFIGSARNPADRPSRWW